MKIIILSPAKYSEGFVFLEKYGHVTRHKEKLSLIKDLPTYDWVISFGYRHIIKKEEIDKCKNPIINLHISYLPYNRGADPNFWSWYENTPKGVTIHFIDEGIDTGEILVQKIVKFKNSETLKTSYETLKNEVFKLFSESFDGIISKQIIPKKQNGDGTYHKSADLKRVKSILSKGWETPISEINDRPRNYR